MHIYNIKCLTPEEESVDFGGVCCRRGGFYLQGAWKNIIRSNGPRDGLTPHNSP